MGILSGCASHPSMLQGSATNIDTIHQSVPASWRTAAEKSTTIEPLEVNDDLREFIFASVRNNARPRDRILALTSAILDRDGIGLVYDDLATLTAVEAFTSGRGNCMGFSNLLVATAREAGIPARFELVSNFRNWQKQDELLVSTLHVRVVSIVSGRRMVFDFYPQPVAAGSWHETLSDSEALAHHINNLAINSMRKGDYADTYGKLYKAIEISPHIGFLWSNLGAVLSRQGLDGPAETAYLEAIAISPELMLAASNLQILYARLGREEEASELSERVSRYRERNPYFQFWQAQLAYDDARYEEAVRYYRAAIRLKKKERDFYIGLADAHHKLGNTKASLNAKARADRLDMALVNRMEIRPVDR